METRSSSNYIWNLKSVLGQGATGAVYTGRHKKSGDVVAVKTSNHLGMMRPLEVRKREFDVLSKLDHENIVKIFASETELRSQNEIIVMELCSGGSLFTMLEHPSNAYGLSEQDCIAVIRDVVAGMKHLHDNGIVHRDLKPGNIMRVYRDDGSCVYKLTDFGAARELMESDQFVSIYGTEEYLHPDLYERGVLRKATGKTFGAQVDLWSIGVTFYHIATGRLPFRPFGGRQNKDTMYHITTRKASGMIAGVQKSEGGEVEWTDKLPDHTCLSQGFRNLLTPLLAGVLESDPAKMMSFDQFFAYVQDMVSRKVLDVYCVSSSQFHKIYIRRTEMLNRFKQMVTEQTSVPCDQQELFYEFQYFQPPDMCPAADFPNTSRDRPVIMIGGEQLAPDKLVNLAIPKITELPPEWTLEGDAAVSKIMANCAYSCEHSVAVYSDSVKAMTDMIHTLGNCFRQRMIDHDLVCKEVESQRNAVHNMTEVYCASQENSVKMLTDVMEQVSFREEERAEADREVVGILELVRMKRKSDDVQSKETAEWLIPLKVTLHDAIANNPLEVEAKAFFRIADTKPLLCTVSTLRARIEEFYNRFRKEKHLRRLSLADEQNHVFDRRKLSAECKRVMELTKHSAELRALLHGELTGWLSRAKTLEARVCQRMGQVYEIRNRDQLHVESMEKFQEQSNATCKRVVERVKGAMVRGSTSSIGTDLPSIVANGDADHGDDHNVSWSELDSHIATLAKVTESSKASAMENSQHIQRLTSSLNEFFHVINESDRQSIEELQKLSMIETQ
ncbi:serine/threonine-protein kinase TBK1 isoform X2 [Nematostella vectensis]|uniref:serine/threonine-protein kinase TBK1 isoform X2 n=1 Tax=Nematostella vectensis TaxID=45351 RepID=UPI002077232A|nr:serine/threonine-protein kinase TBK1 isoform X2 [Nematostella vectensis]